MYLGTALNLAIPYALLDREDLIRVYDGEGPVASEAEKHCADLKVLASVKTSKFTPAQRETARLALCWAEQYFIGYADAQDESDKAEAKWSLKCREQIRKVRLKHFGFTETEVSKQRCITVPVGSVANNNALLNMHKHVVCTNCNTSTNGYSAGDICKSCKTGIFQDINATAR